MSSVSCGRGRKGWGGGGGRGGWNRGELGGLPAEVLDVLGLMRHLPVARGLILTVAHQYRLAHRHLHSAPGPPVSARSTPRSHIDCRPPTLCWLHIATCTPPEPDPPVSARSAPGLHPVSGLCLLPQVSILDRAVRTPAGWSPYYPVHPGLRTTQSTYYRAGLRTTESTPGVGSRGWVSGFGVWGLGCKV